MEIKVLGEFDVIRIQFEGRGEHLEVSGNGDVRTDSITSGETTNIFELREQTAKYQSDQSFQQTAALQNGYSEDWSGFRKQSEYIQLLIQVQGTDHNVHKELDDAIAKIKELTYA